MAFKPLIKTTAFAVRRRKLIAKLDEQIQVTTIKDYTATQQKCTIDGECNQDKVEIYKRVKLWWTTSVDGKISLVVHYGSKLLEFAKGKNAIELASEAEVADSLR